MTLTAADVRETLARHWPDDAHVVIEEAPVDSSRMGNKIDLLVVSCWQSRGLALDAVEIKVSWTDWQRERKNPAKADWWWTHAHRFWIAAPADLATKILPALPPTWGLLAVVDGNGQPTTKTLREAPHHEPEPLPWTTMVGLLRAARGCGLAALSRAEARGRDEGRKLAQSRGPDGYLAEQVERLQGVVRRAEEASGIPLDRWPDREQWGGASVEEVLTGLRALVGDRQAGRRARLELERATKAIDHAAREAHRALDAIPESATPNRREH